MLVKIVSLFLIAMGVLAMFGRLRFPKGRNRKGGRLDNPIICNKCGQIIIGKGTCDCTPPAKKR